MSVGDDTEIERLIPPALTIEQRDPRKLIANPANYRHHPREQVDDIKRSLRDLGQFKNVVVRPDDLILAGHGVVIGAVELGWPQIAVHVFRGTDAQARLLMVADNEIARGAEDDDRALASLLEEVREDFGDLAGTGWTDTELDDRLMALAAQDTEDGTGEDDFADFDELGDLDRVPFRFGEFGCAASADVYAQFGALWRVRVEEQPDVLMEDFLREVLCAGP